MAKPFLTSLFESWPIFQEVQRSDTDVWYIVFEFLSHFSGWLLSSGLRVLTARGDFLFDIRWKLNQIIIISWRQSHDYLSTSAALMSTSYHPHPHHHHHHHHHLKSFFQGGGYPEDYDPSYDPGYGTDQQVISYIPIIIIILISPAWSLIITIMDMFIANTINEQDAGYPGEPLPDNGGSFPGKRHLYNHYQCIR